MVRRSVCRAILRASRATEVEARYSFPCKRRRSSVLVRKRRFAGSIPESVSNYPSKDHDADQERNPDLRYLETARECPGLTEFQARRKRKVPIESCPIVHHCYHHRSQATESSLGEGGNQFGLLYGLNPRLASSKYAPTYTVAHCTTSEPVVMVNLALTFAEARSSVAGRRHSGHEVD